MDWIKSIIEDPGEDKGGNRQISDQFSRHHASFNERIYNRNAAPVDEQTGHIEYKKKPHKHFDQVKVIT